MAADVKQIGQLVQQKSEFVRTLFSELDKVIVGQRYMLERMVIGLLANGHILLEGVPGLAKTLAVTVLSRAIDAEFRRIQFTPDLLPADLIGTQIYRQSDGQFYTRKGPIFANIILADEINRTPPKTQAALLEAMQEHQVTNAGVRHALEEPFFVLATQNPIEMEGTYPLPEAQLDRFMFNVVMDYLPEDEEVAVVTRTTSEMPAAIEPLFSGEDVLRFHEIVRKVPIAEEMVRYAVKLAAASRPHQAGAPDFINQWTSWGAGTRAGQFLVLGAKSRALLRGRAHVTVDDLRTLAAPTLRHRILLNYRAEAEGIRVDDVVKRLLEGLTLPVGA
jgi:MoxR-like ATPase